MKLAAMFLLLLMLPPLALAQEREIKALSADKVQAYVEGKGMEWISPWPPS